MTFTGWVSLRRSGGIAHFPGFSVAATIRIEDLEPDRIADLMGAIEAADYFRRPEPDARSEARDAHTHHITIIVNGRSRTMAIPEPVSDQALAHLLRTARELVSSASA